MSDKKKTAHVVMGNNCVRCLHCGVKQDIAMPCSLSVFAAIGEAFVKDHRSCKPGPAKKYATPEEWLRGGDTGMSSETIYAFMMDGYCARPAIPYDADDFGRCHRLLKAFPEWRKRMPQMRDVDGWRKFSAQWDRIEKAYESELAAGAGFAETYRLLVACRQ